MFCKECQRKRRVGERLRIVRSKRYWVTYCVMCKTELALERADDIKPKEDD